VIDQAIGELAPLVGVKAACTAVGRARATHYRHHRHSPPPPRRDRVPASQPRALSEVERQEGLRILHDPEHGDEAPATVYAKLLDAGVYLCSGVVDAAAPVGLGRSLDRIWVWGVLAGGRWVVGRLPWDHVDGRRIRA
jgi:hypothetical protein